jgi:Asp/Glu/hydantoin racemase
MNLAIIHASRAAVDPVAEYYKAHAPGWELTNLLDDGVMRMLLVRDWAKARRRLLQLVQDAEREYGAEAILLTCSALPIEELELLRRETKLRVDKIDEAMAREAVQAGRRVGILSTFPSTQETTRGLLLATAGNKQIELVEVLEAAALQALLAGDVARHDELFFGAVEQFRGRVDCLVLAQVSMARLAAETERRLGVPVFESLSSSFRAWAA